MKPDLHYWVVGTNHCTAPVEVREKYAIPASVTTERLGGLLRRSGLREAVILSTCNRVEVYAAAESASPGADEALFGFLEEIPKRESTDRKYFYSHQGPAAVKHLFEVASGLDSMVVGETEVLGQVKSAYQAASDTGATGRFLNKLFQKSFQVAKWIRTTSRIGEGSVSVASVAADLALQIFGDLERKKILLMGAGAMSATTARALHARGCSSIIVSNRMHERAVQLADELGGQAARFDEWQDHFLDADILVSSTACPFPIIRRDDLEPLLPKRGHRPAFLIDIAVPRNIERGAGDLENVYLYDIDDLKVIADRNLALREREILECRRKIESAAAEFLADLARAPDAARRPSPLPALSFGGR